MSPLQRLDRSPFAKMAVAVLIFCAIVGGWLAYERYREARATLPDAQQREGACTLWFVGSSSIHRWTNMERDMAPWTVRNRGIDNATFAQILPRFANAREDGKPAAIILYAGENDIASGTPVRAVVRELAAFLDQRDRMLDDVPVLVLSMKPSPGRWSSREGQRLYNAGAQRLISYFDEVYFADITTPLLNGGKLGDNYQPDGVHMNEAGYRIWAKVVRQRLREILPEARLKRCDPV